MSRLGNLYRAGLLVTAPLMLQACGDANLTLEEALAQVTLSNAQILDCHTSKAAVWEESCEGALGTFTGMSLASNEFEISEDCEAPTNVKLSLFEPRREDTDALRELKSLEGRCVTAVFRVKEQTVEPLFVTEVEADSEFTARVERIEAAKQAKLEAERERQAQRQRASEARALSKGFDYSREFLIATEDGGFERFTTDKRTPIKAKVEALALEHVSIQQNAMKFNQSEYVPFSSLREPYLNYAKLLWDPAGKRWPKKSSFETKNDYLARDDTPTQKLHEYADAMFVKTYADVEVCSDHYTPKSQKLYLSWKKHQKLGNPNPWGPLKEDVYINAKWTDDRQERSTIYFQPDGWFLITVSPTDARQAFASNECTKVGVYGFVLKIRDSGKARIAMIVPTVMRLGDKFYYAQKY